MADKERKRLKPKYGRDYKKLLELFIIVLKLGAFTFGGGYAMFPLMEREYVEKRGWFETQEMLDMLAVAQSLPGMISINASILVGYRLFGILGASVAVIGLALPSLIVLSIISFFYVKFRENIYVNTALKGIRVAVVALLVQAVIKLGKPGVRGVFGWVMACAAFLVALIFSIHPVIIILGGLLAGIIYTQFFAKKEGDAQ
jgi:chromate transporter